MSHRYATDPLSLATENQAGPNESCSWETVCFRSRGARAARPCLFLALFISCTGGTPNTVRLALLDWRTGFQPGRADSASRLSANETTGWKPVGQDRRDAYPPAKLTVLGGTPALLGGISASTPETPAANNNAGITRAQSHDNARSSGRGRGLTVIWRIFE